jgi:hypothetical protein
MKNGRLMRSDWRRCKNNKEKYLTKAEIGREMKKFTC